MIYSKIIFFFVSIHIPIEYYILLLFLYAKNDLLLKIKKKKIIIIMVLKIKTISKKYNI